MSESMSDAEYLATQHRLILLAQFAHQIDAQGFLERIEIAHAVAPIIDPTLYQEGREQLHYAEALARALLPFKVQIERQIAAGKASGLEDVR